MSFYEMSFYRKIIPFSRRAGWRFILRRVVLSFAALSSRAAR